MRTKTGEVGRGGVRGVAAACVFACGVLTSRVASADERPPEPSAGGEIVAGTLGALVGGAGVGGLTYALVVSQAAANPDARRGALLLGVLVGTPALFVGMDVGVWLADRRTSRPGRVGALVGGTLAAAVVCIPAAAGIAAIGGAGGSSFSRGAFDVIAGVIAIGGPLAGGVLALDASRAPRISPVVAPTTSGIAIGFGGHF